MPLLYEPEGTLSQGTYKIGFRIDFRSMTPEEAKKRAFQKFISYAWYKRGLLLKKVELDATQKQLSGYLTLQVQPSFIPFLAIAVLVPSILGLVGTLAQVWLVSTVVNPLLAPGPLGLPMIAWILITAAGVLIPLAIIMTRRRT